MSDCGCGGGAISPATTTYEQRQELKRRGVVGSRSGAPTAPAAAIPAGPDAPAGPGPGPDTATGAYATGPISRLNAVDGLFLRAAHLNGIQDYALALTRALGIGLGRGVAYGYQVDLIDTVLKASAGLAYTDTGDPLQTGDTLSFDLADLPPREQHGYWLIVLEGGDQAVDHEKAYGSVCADPCDGSATIQPWRQSLVRLRLLARTMPGLDDAPIGRRRNLLASRYFDQERCAAQPWPVPDAADRVVDPLRPRPWTEGGGAPGPMAGQVPIGVLLQLDDGKADRPFKLDQWTARRELAGPPGELRWAGHLAMRPWSVFLAQVLQFADQWRETELMAAPVTKHVLDNPVLPDLDEFFAHNPIRSKPALEALAALKAKVDAKRYAAFVTTGGTRPLRDVFGELPPAGYLAPIADGEEGESAVRRMFDEERVVLHFCQVRADVVAGAVQAAQHLDRIPLDGTNGVKPEVDILVPSVPADLPTTVAQSYGWIAFVRSTVRRCDVDVTEPRTETEIIAATTDQLEMVQRQLDAGAKPDAFKRVGEVEYPVGVADWPPGQSEPKPIEGAVVIGAFGVADQQAAANLAADRAKAAVDAWGVPGAVPVTAVVSAQFPHPTLIIVIDSAHPDPVPN